MSYLKIGNRPIFPLRKVMGRTLRKVERRTSWRKNGGGIEETVEGQRTTGIKIDSLKTPPCTVRENTETLKEVL